MSNLYDWNKRKPGHMPPPPPPPPPHGGLKPVPPQYPYMTPDGHDSYAHDVFHEYHGYPHPHEFPTNGPMIGSGFMLLNYNPFLFDTTHVKYGNFLSVSENVNTRISRRRDNSCINLDASFNLTGQVIRNTVMQQHLEQSIGNHFNTLEGVLPIIKSDITFRLYYTVQDDMGGVVHQAVCTVTTPQMNFHYTDIRDYFVTSLKSIFVANIPAMEYTGMYKLILEKLDVFADVVDTQNHISDNMNPYYQFADNNNKIVIQHDTIQREIADNAALIASAKLSEVIPFQANVTTRLRISFVAFLDELIAVPQTYGIWNAMFAPTDEKIDKALKEITTLKESVMLLTDNVSTLQNTLNDLQFTVNEHGQSIDELKILCGNLSNDINTKTGELESRFDDLEHRVTVLEQRPQALVRYRADFNFVPSQLTWDEYGTLYQSAKTFTSSGDMEADIAAGNIVPLTVDGDIVLDSIVERLDGLDEDVASIKEEMELAQFDIGSLKAKDEQILGTVGEIRTEQDAMSERLDTVETTASQLTETVTTIGETVDGLNTSITNIDERVTTIETNVNNVTNDLSAVTSRVETTEVNVANLTDTVNTLSENVTTNTTNLETLTTAVENNTTNITNLATSVEEVQTSITTIDEQLDNVESSLVSIGDTVDALTDQIGQIDVSAAPVVEYEYDTTYPVGKIVYAEAGKLYQVTNVYTTTSDTTIEKTAAIASDVEAGYLVPVGDTNVENLTSQVSTLSTNVDSLSTNVTNLSSSVDNKVDKEEGMGLSSNDYTDEDKALLHSLENRLEFNTYLEFPTVGEENTLYVDTGAYKMYVWEPDTQSYRLLDVNNFDYDEIQISM